MTMILFALLRPKGQIPEQGCVKTVKTVQTIGTAYIPIYRYVCCAIGLHTIQKKNLKPKTSTVI